MCKALPETVAADRLHSALANWIIPSADAIARRILTSSHYRGRKAVELTLVVDRRFGIIAHRLLEIPIVGASDCLASGACNDLRGYDKVPVLSKETDAGPWGWEEKPWWAPEPAVVKLVFTAVAD